MKALMFACAGLAAVTLVPLPASAAPGGCLKYGAAGAVAGHFAGHHGVLGAVAGCAVGAWKRHEARRYERKYRNSRGYPSDRTGSVYRDRSYRQGDHTY